jgi:hypothetical protein
MGQTLFGRYATLTFGVPGKQGRIIESIATDDDGNLVDGLRLQFKIEKTSEPSPNKAEIKIYNLNQDSINELHKKGSVVALEVGYYSNLDDKDPVSELIFKGDLMKIETTKAGGDYITTLETGDGAAAYAASNFNGSFAPGASIADVASQVMSSFTGTTQAPPEGVEGQFVNGATLSGSSKDVMDQIAGKTGSEWSIQDARVQIIPVNGFTKLPVIVLQSIGIDPETGDPVNTGLIGSPNLSGFTHSQDKKNVGGVEFKSLMNAGLKPGRRVQIISKNDKVNGNFVVKKVTHNGDTRQGPWYSECEGIHY